MALADTYSETLVNAWSQDLQSATRSMQDISVALKIYTKQYCVSRVSAAELQLTAAQMNRLKLAVDGLVHTAVPVQQNLTSAVSK